MTNIQEKDIVKLTRNINDELKEGLVGIVVQCHQDKFDVHFPIPGNDLNAQVSGKDIQFVIETKSVTN
jgi:hypothetical protein